MDKLTPNETICFTLSSWATPLRPIGVDVTTMTVILYGLNDPILFWMVSQAGRLTRAARNLLFSLRPGRRQGRRPGRREGCSWPSPLAYQPDSPTARGGGGPERVPTWRCPTEAPVVSLPPQRGAVLPCRPACDVERDRQCGPRDAPAAGAKRRWPAAGCRPR